MLALLARVPSLLRLTICHGLHGVLRWDEMLTAKLPSSLTQLRLSNCIGVDSLDAVAACQRLRGLKIIGASQLSDLTPLANLQHLTSLRIRFCSRLKVLSPLSACTSLEILHVNNHQGTTCFTLETFPRLPRLRELRLIGCLEGSLGTELLSLLVPQLASLHLEPGKVVNNSLLPASLSGLLHLRKFYVNGFGTDDVDLLPVWLAVEELDLIYWKYDLRLATACGPRLRRLKVEHGPYWFRVPGTVAAIDTAPLQQCSRLEELELEGPFVPHFMQPVAEGCAGLTRLVLPWLAASDLRAAIATVANAAFAHGLRSLELRGRLSFEGDEGGDGDGSEDEDESDDTDYGDGCGGGSRDGKRPLLDGQLLALLASLSSLQHLRVEHCLLSEHPTWAPALRRLSLLRCLLPDLGVAALPPTLASMSLDGSAGLRCDQLLLLTGLAALKHISLKDSEVQGEGVDLMMKSDKLRALVSSAPP